MQDSNTKPSGAEDLTTSCYYSNNLPVDLVYIGTKLAISSPKMKIKILQ